MIQRFDIDGLRIDAVRLMEIDFTTTLKTAIQRRVTTTGILFYMIGETFTDEHGKEEIGSYLGEYKLDGQFDFPLYHHVVKTFLLQSETLEQLDGFTKENDHTYQKEFYSGALMGNFIGNHDVARALSLANRDFDGVTSQGGAEANDRVWENSPVLPEEQLPFDKLVNGLTFIFTLPGIPIIYQGDEIGMPGANDPDNRRMMLFGDELSVNQKRNLERLRMLGKFRHDHPAMQEGSRETLLLKGNFYAVRMSSGDDTVIAVFNNGDTEITEKFATKTKASGFQTLYSGEKIPADDGKIEFTAAPFSSELIFAGE
jgi:glycosidase